MEKLTTIIAEANKDVSELSKKWKNQEDITNHYQPFYERVKNQCDSLQLFKTICIQDFVINQNGLRLIGGGITPVEK